jgi:hypothetical protein
MDPPLTFAELKRWSVQDLKDLYDERTTAARGPTPTAQFVLEEIHRRDGNEQTRVMLAYTRRMTYLTVVVTILTAVNVALVAYTTYTGLCAAAR